jgi:hypothetical protein
VSAKHIVKTLLETDPVDPKQFLALNPDIALQNTLTSNGWRIKTPGIYTKDDLSFNVGWIVEIYKFQGAYHTACYGQKFIDSFATTDFEIGEGPVFTPGQSVEEFTLDLDNFLADKHGPPDDATQDDDGGTVEDYDRD